MWSVVAVFDGVKQNYSIIIKSSTGTPQFILCFWFFFYKLKVSDHAVPNKSIGVVFPTAFADFVSLCHILVILAYFKLFHCYFVMVICER